MTAAVVALLIAAAVFIGYRQAVFQIACNETAAEKVFERRSDVEGLLIGDAPAWDSSWTTWLVAKGGYQYVDRARANSLGVIRDYERIFWRSHIGDIGGMTVATTPAKYAIRVERTFPRDFIARWSFEALDRTTNQVLARKVVLFLQAWGFDRSCPSIRSSGEAGADLFEFFAKRVLLPKDR